MAKIQGSRIGKVFIGKVINDRRQKRDCGKLRLAGGKNFFPLIRCFLKYGKLDDF
jgi:hypothetical protein